MEKKKHVFKGIATSEGIILHSQKDPNIYYYTYYDENEKIRTSPLQSFWYENEKRKDMEKGAKFPTNPIAITILIILLIFNMMFVRLGKVHVAFGLIFLINAVYPLVNIVKFLLLSKPQNACWHTLAKYHSAKHMTINAFNKHQRIPTFEEASKSSRIIETCESLGDINQLVYYFFFSMIVIFLYKLNIQLYVTILFSYLAIMILVRKYGLLKVAGFIYTIPATEKEIKLAIAAIEHYVENEKNYD